VSAPVKPWPEWSEIERRAERRRLAAEFVEMGYAPQTARELAVLAEEWADDLWLTWPQT
jgi:hypothetical protein